MLCVCSERGAGVRWGGLDPCAWRVHVGQEETAAVKPEILCLG